MAGYEEKKAELADLGVTVYVASVDSGDEAQTVAAELSFGIGEGVTRETADTIGVWWEERRNIIQPSEFVLRRGGKIVQSSYSDGPLARTLAEDVCVFVGFLRKQ